MHSYCIRVLRSILTNMCVYLICFFFSDILDDDSNHDFLEALKKQMEGTNVLNASAREVKYFQICLCTYVIYVIKPKLLSLSNQMIFNIDEIVLSFLHQLFPFSNIFVHAYFLNACFASILKNTTDISLCVVDGDLSV